jgi:hypothetical protein
MPDFQITEGGLSMNYLMLIYTKEEARAAMTPEEAEKIKAQHWAVIDESKKLGILKGVNPLHPTSTATTVRVHNGKVVTTDGPFAETKEQLAGYYVLDCKDLDEAIAWAARIPTTCGGAEGCIEIRPVSDLPSRQVLSAPLAAELASIIE